MLHSLKPVRDEGGPQININFGHLTREIFLTVDGSHSIRIREQDISNRSRCCAIRESRAVFLEPLLVGGQELKILEIGFGIGLNALLTLQLAAAQYVPLSYVGL